MAWFAIAARKSMSMGKGQSKISQITINISTILNALGAEKSISYNLPTIQKDGGGNKPKGEKHEGPSRQRNVCGG